MTKVRCVKLDCKYNSENYICKCKEIAFKDSCSDDGVMECKQYEKSQEFAKAEAIFLSCMPNGGNVPDKIFERDYYNVRDSLRGELSYETSEYIDAICNKSTFWDAFKYVFDRLGNDNEDLQIAFLKETLNSDTDIFNKTYVECLRKMCKSEKRFIKIEAQAIYDLYKEKFDEIQ